MFGKSKIVRLVRSACLAAAGLLVGGGLLQPSQAGAWEIIRPHPIVRVGPVVPVVPVAPPVVRVVPVVPVAPPVVRVGPIAPVRTWFGWRR